MNIKVTNKIIEVKGLKKTYGSGSSAVHAVKGIDFYVEQGKLFAFLGPNGAGKSTTIDIICTLLSQDSGEVTIDGYRLGHDNDRIREQIGVVFQDSVLDPLLTVKENLKIRSRLYTMSREERAFAIKNAIRVAEVQEFQSRPYGKLSGGQRRRADIARALINKPKVLFLDEPTTGLDPQTRQSVWNTISELQKQQGMTVFLTTHYMEEAANADYIIIVDNGEISARGTPYQLKEAYSTDWLKVKPSDTKACSDKLNSLGHKITVSHGIINIPLSHTKNALPIIPQISEFIESFEVVRGTMDDVFINVTGREMREDA